MSRKQSVIDRVKRLSEGRCPVHGIPMPQVDRWYAQEDGLLSGKQYTIVECPRADCQIRAKAYQWDGPWELLPEWKYLLIENTEPS